MRLYDGSFVQFRCDEKGFLSICAFGLPGRSQENGPSRATEAALSLVAAMREIDQVDFRATHITSEYLRTTALYIPNNTEQTQQICNMIQGLQAWRSKCNLSSTTAETEQSIASLSVFVLFSLDWPSAVMTWDVFTLYVSLLSSCPSWCMNTDHKYCHLSLWVSPWAECKGKHGRPQAQSWPMLQDVVIGLTTGQVFCACVGSRVRNEYTVYGDAINLSARLMMKAQCGIARILSDKTTAQLAEKSALFYKLDPIKVCIALGFVLGSSLLISSWRHCGLSCCYYCE